jgi:hypothetical protein
MNDKDLAIRLRTFRAAKTLPNVEIPKELIDKVIEALESHDDRVKGLIKACSTEVVKRREINAHRLVLLSLMQVLRSVFKYYAKNHREKDFDGMTENQIQLTLIKAKTNDEWANKIDEAILWQSPAGAMGTP